MKRTILAILLVCAALSSGADTAALNMADRGLNALDRSDKAVDSLTASLVKAGDEKAELGRQIGERDQWVIDAKKERDAARSWGDFIPILVLHGIGAVAAIGAAYCLLTRQTNEALVLGFISALNIAGGIAVNRYAQQIGLYAMIGGAVLLTGGIIFAVYSAWQYRHSSEEHANVVPLAEKSGRFAADQINFLRALSFQETGRLADRVREAVTGKTQSVIAAEAAAPLAAQTVSVPVVAPVVAVTSGVVTPINPASL